MGAGGAGPASAGAPALGGGFLAPTCGGGFATPATTSAARANALARADRTLLPFVFLRGRRGLFGTPLLLSCGDFSSMTGPLAPRGPAVHGLDILPGYAGTCKIKGLGSAFSGLFRISLR